MTDPVIEGILSRCGSTDRVIALNAQMEFCKAIEPLVHSVVLHDKTVDLSTDKTTEELIYRLDLAKTHLRTARFDVLNRAIELFCKHLIESLVQYKEYYGFILVPKNMHDEDRMAIEAHIVVEKIDG